MQNEETVTTEPNTLKNALTSGNRLFFLNFGRFFFFLGDLDYNCYDYD